MKIKSFGQTPARTRERGYTFTEVLIVLGIVAALAIGAFVLFTQRGASTEMGQVAQQIGETISSQQRMIAAGMRGSKVSSREFASAVGNMLATHKFITGGAGGAVPSVIAAAFDSAATPLVAQADPSGAAIGAANVCASAGISGFTIFMANTGTSALNEQELIELQSQIIAAIKNPFANPLANGNYSDVLEVAVGTTTGVLDNSATPTITGAENRLGICLQ